MKSSAQNDRSLLADQEGFQGANGGSRGTISSQATEHLPLAEMEERSAELKAFEADLGMLAECFVDMKALVEEQGESLNIVEDQGKAAKEQTRRGNMALDVALATATPKAKRTESKQTNIF